MCRASEIEADAVRLARRKVHANRVISRLISKHFTRAKKASFVAVGEGGGEVAQLPGCFVLRERHLFRERAAGQPKSQRAISLSELRARWEIGILCDRVGLSSGYIAERRACVFG